MSSRSLFILRLSRVIVLASLFILVLPAVLFAQSDVSRKIIYISNYKPIPGDEYTLTIDFGPTNVNGTSGSSVATYPLVLQEDRTLELPYIGTFHVGANETLTQLRKRIVDSIRKRVPVQYVSFTLQAPAVFDVFVYGTVTKPGQIQMTSLNRLTDVLASAGMDSASSTRRIELKRKGKTIIYDLTKYYVFGQENEDPYLLPGDEVFVPRIKDSITLSGSVARPGTYEILPGDTLGRMIKIAGGLLPTALTDQVTLQRVNAQNRYTERAVATDEIDSLKLENGDRITVPGSARAADRITVEGAVYGKAASSDTPQSVPNEPVRFDIPYHPGITLLDVLDLMGGPTPFAETDKSYIIRASTGQRMPVPDLEQIWRNRSPARNIVLRQGDYVVIPMKKLTVAVVGEVNSPNPVVPFVSGYTVGDYLQSAGGINPQTGDSNAIYFVSTLGKRTKVGLGTIVPPGATILVAKNSFTNMQQFFSNFFIVTGWVTSLIGVTITVIDFLNTVRQ